MATDERVTTTPAAPPSTLGAAFDPRANSLDVLRLLLAATVAVVHGSMIGWGHQPHVGATEVGALAVDAFFVLSGFLVTRSLLRLDSVGAYAWHRVLRIMPGFWVCLVVTAFVVAPVLALLEGDPASAVLAHDPPAWRYVIDNALLYIGDDGFAVAGRPFGTYTPGVVDGALWTLVYEATCYALVAVLGVLGLLRRHRWAVVALALACAVVLAGQDLDLLPERGALFVRFFTVFLAGVLAQLYGDRLVLRRRWLALALGVTLGALVWCEDYRWIGAAAFAYVCLYAVVRTPWLRWRLRADLSYGVYVYHWPVEVLLVSAGATALGRSGLAVVALLLTAGVAALSWRFVERPALAHKDARPWRRRA